MSRAEISIDTLSPGADVSGHDLLVAIAQGFFSYAVVDANGQLKLFEKFARSPQDGVGFLSLTTHNEWLTKTYRQVKVAYFSLDAVSMPSKFYQPANAATHLDTVYGDAVEHILLNDFISHRSIYCLYRVEKDLVRSVVRSFPLATAWHVQSLLLSQKKENTEGVSLQVNFLRDACCFMLQKNGQLLAIRSYPFTNIADVAYTLLAFCQMHEINADDVQLTAGGWINPGSPMHEELRKYFMHTGFTEYPAVPQGFEQFPAHFFEIFHLLQSL